VENISKTIKSKLKIREVKGLVVTDVRVRKILTEGKMKAIVSVTLDDMFVIHDVKVVEGQNGLFVAMPSRKTPDGEFRDIAHPITSSAREVIQNAVLQAYEAAI
jgi:stage V sporulation protein G